MPRDANGNYSLPAGNPVVTQTAIATTWANSTMSDLAAEMTDSLSRSGKGGLTGPFPIIDKDGALPGLNFVAEPTSGYKREATGDTRMQVLGNDKMRWTSTGDADVFRGGTWQQVATQPSGQRAMTGVGGTTTIYMYNAAVPPLDWTLANPDVNVRNLTIGGTGGTFAGSDDPTNLSQGVSISVSGSTSTVSGHQHFYQFNTSTPNEGDVNAQAGVGVSAARQNHTHNSGAQQTQTAGSHSHTFSDSGSDTVTFQPRHVMGLLAKLNG